MGQFWKADQGKFSRAPKGQRIARVDVRVVAVLQGERRMVSPFGRDIALPDFLFVHSTLWRSRLSFGMA
jgi:hypothetical protein